MEFNHNQETVSCGAQTEAVRWMERHPEVFGPCSARDEVLAELEKDEALFAEYQRLSQGLKEEFLHFCMGVNGMRITYDPMFKFVFDPGTKPERLEEFISLCLGEEVKILQVIPNESGRLTEGGSLLVMDILVRLASGALVNVEIQRVGYLFPGARCACYSSDLLMRQYSQVREEKRRAGERFSYHDIKRVYTIVLIQKSTAEFHRCPKEYLHYARQTFNTGLELDMLQEYLLIPLDIFRENHQNISRKLDAWLLFIASDQPCDIREVIEAYPEFAELYREVFDFRYHKKELVSMYSEALRILDQNTVELMVELQQEEIKALREKNLRQEEEMRRQKAEMCRQETENLRQKEEILRLQKLLDQKNT